MAKKNRSLQKVTEFATPGTWPSAGRNYHILAFKIQDNSGNIKTFYDDS